ncbi:MAG: hypothetical protein AAGI69_15875 [Cyanobacteria bacterium P01_H01_bin.21]
MGKKSKIVDNSSAQDILEQINGFDGFEALYRAVPFSKKLFPKLEKVFSDFSKLKDQASILLIPDQFNEIFSQHGWIAYESMNFEVMKGAINLYKYEGLTTAEEYLTDSYDEKALKWGIIRFNGHSEFCRRIRLVELAKDDYLSGRYHGCVPLLLSLIDGLVNDVSKHVGFFAENVDLTAWDCIAAHETGLQTLASLLNKGRNKTSEDLITIPYRNGILHGRDLAFDNKIVAAKCWAALFAVRDWAKALDDGKKEPKVKEKVSWKKLLSQMTETSRINKAFEEWQPRTSSEFPYIPFAGDPTDLPANTPERAASEFIDHWCNERYGPMANALLYVTNTTPGKKAGMARDDFSRYVPSSFEVLDIDDRSAAVSHVEIELYFEIENKTITKQVSVCTMYRDSENNFSARSQVGGHWKIMQNSFKEVIYAASL